MKNTGDYIRDREEEFMITISQALANQMKSIVMNAWPSVYLIKSIYEKIRNGEIEIESEFKSPNVVNAYNVLQGTEYPDLNLAVWLSGNASEIQKELRNLTVPDRFMREIFSSLDLTEQIGLIISQGEFQYLYPLDNITYINADFKYLACPGITSYNPICTDGYVYLSNSSYNDCLNIYYENDKLNLLYRSDFGAGINVWPEDFIRNKLDSHLDYTIFVAQYLGIWTLFASGVNITSKTEKELTKVLYDDQVSQQDFAEQVLPILEKKNGSSRVEINKVHTYFAISNIKFDLKNDLETGYVVGVATKESKILSLFHNMVENTMFAYIGLICILVLVFIFSVILTWALCTWIARKNIQPLDIFLSKLAGEKIFLENIHKDSTNSEVNKLIENLEKLEKIKKLTDPSEISHEILLKNFEDLNEIIEFYQKIKNKRGLSIVYNLIGNLKFSIKEYLDATKNYELALQALEELLKSTETGQKNQQSFKKNTELSQNTATDRDFINWEDEKNSIKGLICNMLQQICYSETVRLKGISDISDNTSPWKKIYLYQIRILQHYEYYRTDYNKYLKIMIDMAEVSQYLQHFHTAIELLSIVHEELQKIKSEHPTRLHVDINQLIRIGIFIDPSKGRLHFEAESLALEKEILLQMIYYRRGMIELDMERYQQAAKFFALALVLSI